MKALIIAMVVAFIIGISIPKCNDKIKHDVIVDTVILRETIRDTILIPQKVYITRYDTVLLKVIDTATTEKKVIVPIETKEYKTKDYHAKISGFNPSLDFMEVYQQTKIINRTETVKVTKKPKFGVGIQVGYGYSNEQFYPYIGVGITYNLFSF